MDWFKDRKNLPFVIGGALVLILGSLAFLLYNLGVFNRPAPVASTVTISPTLAPATGTATVLAARPLVGTRPRVAVPVTVPRVSPAAPKLAKVDPNQRVNPAAVHDPFSFATLHARPQTVTPLVLPPVRTLLPSHDIYSGAPAAKQAHLVASLPSAGYLPTLQSPAPEIAMPRVAGILYDRGVYAILQPPYGQAQSVKPGDSVPGVGRVTSIQSDGVTIKTTAGATVQLPITAGTTGPAYPGGPYGGGPPDYGNNASPPDYGPGAAANMGGQPN